MPPGQRALFDVEPQPARLTDRQAFVLELLQRAGADGLLADEVGAALCERKGRHPAGRRCDFDKANGLGVLRALWTKGVARSRRDGTWLATVAAPGDASFGDFETLARLVELETAERQRIADTLKGFAA